VPQNNICSRRRTRKAGPILRGVALFPLTHFNHLANMPLSVGCQPRPGARLLVYCGLKGTDS
jgi:hypothetical protein